MSNLEIQRNARNLMADSKEFTAYSRNKKDKTDLTPNCSVPNCALPCKPPPSPPGCKACRKS